MRDKVYAHNEIDFKLEEISKNVKNEDINKILQILTNVSNALLQAEANGHQPDFSYNNDSPINSARKNAEQLINSLLIS